MADWMPKSARPYRPASAEPDVSGVESFARGAYQGAGMGFADEQAGALDAIGGHLKRTFTNDWKRTGGGWWDDIKAEAEQVADDYRKGRDESRQAYSEAAEANPTAYGVGQFGGAVATGLLTGGASALGREGLKGALTAGALEGAAGGLGGSEADLTHADLDAYAKAFRDSTEGGITGAGLGAGFYGAGKGLKWIGGKAVDGLRRARGELAEGVAAERAVADDAARAAEDEAAAKLAKDEYSARQMNSHMDERAAREEAKRAAKEARDAARAKAQQQKDFRAANEMTQVDKRYADPNAVPPPRAGRSARAPVAPEGPVEDPNTAILGGYRGKAGERRAVNYDRVRQYRQDIADPNFTGDRARLEQYAREYGDAVDNPGAFERRMVERYLRENYPPEVADRILRERVGPNGEILPRGGAEPVTQAADLGDAFQQGRGPEVARQGGGGSAFGQDYPADARTVSDVVPEGWDPGAPKSGDPFHDAKTEFGLAYMGKSADEPGLMGGVDQYRFIDPKTNRPYQLEAFSDPRKPGQVSLEYVGPDDIPAGEAMGSAYNAQKNQVGPGVMRKVLREMRERYPDANRMTSERMTGWNGNRDIDMALPPRQQPATAPQPPMGDFERTIAARNAENLPASGRRAAREWETAEQTVVDGLPPIPPGMRRLYRGEASGGKPWMPDTYPEGSLNYEDIKNADGRWFTDRAGVAHEYARRAAELSEGAPVSRYLDVPESEARAYRMDTLPEGRFSDEAFREWLPPKATAARAGVMPHPTDVPLGLDEGRNANVPFWNRGIGDDVWPEAAAEEIRSTDPTQRINLGDITQRMDLGDAVRQGRGDIARMGGGGSAWQDFGPDARTVSDFIPERDPPVSGDDLRHWLDLTQEARGGAPDNLPPLEELTQPGAPSFPSDVRRAQPFQAPPQLRPEYRPQPPPEAAPTRDLRPASPPVAAPRPAPQPAPVYDPNNSMVSPRDFDAETVVPLGDTQVPREPMASRFVRPPPGPAAPELAPEPILANPLRQARPRPLAPPVAPPSQTVMGAPPGSLVRQARPSVEELAMQREQGALGDVLSAGWEGAKGANNALAAPFGAAYGIGKEAMQNPAVRARAISIFRLDRLARVRPEVWARVGPTLQRAFQSGPERFKAERHVLLLRDPEFRAAEAEADAELERMDGQSPTRRAAGAR